MPWYFGNTKVCFWLRSSWMLIFKCIAVFGVVFVFFFVSFSGRPTPQNCLQSVRSFSIYIYICMCVSLSFMQMVHALVHRFTVLRTRSDGIFGIFVQTNLCHATKNGRCHKGSIWSSFFLCVYFGMMQMLSVTTTAITSTNNNNSNNKCFNNDDDDNDSNVDNDREKNTVAESSCRKCGNGRCIK